MKILARKVWDATACSMRVTVLKIAGKHDCKAEHSLQRVAGSSKEIEDFTPKLYANVLPYMKKYRGESNNFAG